MHAAHHACPALLNRGRQTEVFRRQESNAYQKCLRLSERNSWGNESSETVQEFFYFCCAGRTS